MKNANLSTAGVVTFWTTKCCSRDRIHSVLSIAGYEQLTPSPRSDRSALECAVKDYAKELCPKGQEVLVKPLKQPGTNGFEVRYITRGIIQNDMNHVFSARVDSGIISVTSGYANSMTILDLYRANKAICTSEAVGQALVNGVSLLEGISLRETGGFYWLTDDAMATWNKISNAIESVSDTVVTTGKWEANTKTIKLVKDRLMEDITQSCKEILADITDGVDHDEAYFSRRMGMVRSMVHRVERIESTLESSLDDVRSSLDLVNQALVQTSLCSL